MGTIADICTLREVIQGRRIFIPPIQRHYAWNVGDTARNPTGSQSSKLVEDLKHFSDQMSNGGIEKYFLGNLIVVVEEGQQLDSDAIEWQLLDGQQRLTSFSLLMRALWYQLDGINSELAHRLQTELDNVCLSLDQERFTDYDHRFPIKHRRPGDLSTYKYFMDGRIGAVTNDTNLGRVALKYREIVRDFTTDREIEEFLNNVLDNVIVSLTITDDLVMGFQMFQTANARGLPLSAYDMFRAFVVKKIESDFSHLPMVRRQRLHDSLNDLEEVFQGNRWGDSDKKRESNLKEFISSYMSMRSGLNLRANTIITRIEIEVDGITEPRELNEYLVDMLSHAETWREQIQPNIVDERESYSWRFIRRMNRMRVKIYRGAYLAFFVNLNTAQQRIWLIKVLEWAIIKQLLKEGQLRGNTEIFSAGLPQDMNLFWRRGGQPLESDFTNFRERWLNEKIPDEELNLQVQRYDSDNYCFYALLHRLEGGDGLASHDPGRSTKTTKCIRLAPLDEAGDGFDHIGNFFLTSGTTEGLDSLAIQNHEASEDMNSRLETIMQFASNVDHNMNTELLNLDENSNFEQFIAQRSARIYQSLNEKYLEFMQSEPPL